MTRERGGSPAHPDDPDAAMRAKLATMTYSFAQQMPRLPSHPAPPTPTPARPEDPNFPQLSRPNRDRQVPRAWDIPTPAQPLPTRWGTTPHKPATAAEVVASKPSESALQDEEDAKSAKREAELALFSKLVPTTSAVPRNPGSSLGSGGLRATGSVATQKSTRLNSNTALHAPQAVHAVSRKEPLSSGMRNLSSQVSKPQLARRVARPSRTPSATPPPQSGPASDDDGAFDTAEDIAAEVVESKLTEEKNDTKDVFLKNVVAVYGKVEKKPLRPARRPEPTSLSAQRPHSAEFPSSGRSNLQSAATRRLSEALPNSARFETGRTPSPVPTRHDQIGALRRAKGPSPPPSAPSQKKNGMRDNSAPSQRNGRSTRRDGPKDTGTDVPPGFESRTASITKAGFMSRPKSEGRGPHGSKTSDREGNRVRPQNERASAFRDAINTRKQSSSQRPGNSRRASNGDGLVESSRGPNGKATDNRPGFDKDSLQRRSSAKPVRPTSAPVRRSSAANGSPASGARQTKAKAHSSVGRSDGEEALVDQLQKQTSSSREKQADGERFEAMLQPDEDWHYPDQSSLHGLETDESKASDTRHPGNPEEDHLPSRIQIQHNFSYSGVSGVSLTGTAQEPTARADFNNLALISNGGTITEQHLHHCFEHVNGSDAEDGLPHQLAHEALVNDLLSHDDEEYEPIHSRMAKRPVVAAPGASMLDLVRHMHLRSANQPFLGEGTKGEEVLPPLPNSAEEARFEQLLRDMGWTPLEEDETSKSHHANTIGFGMRQDSPRVVRSEGLSTELRPSDGNGDGEKVQRSYYSHFQ